MAAIKTWFSRYRSCEHWSPRLAHPSPSVRPRSSVVAGVARQDAERGARGRMPLRAVPPPRRRDEGTRSAAEGRNVGTAFLVTFVRGAQSRLTKVTRPGGRNKNLQNTR